MDRTCLIVLQPEKDNQTLTTFLFHAHAEANVVAGVLIIKLTVVIANVENGPQVKFALLKLHK